MHFFDRFTLFSGRRDQISLMGVAWSLTQRRILLPGLDDKVWFLGERVHRWWDGPFLRRVPVAPPRDMF